ncbi:metal-dependent hydrolase [Caldalkalibacillus salinus]|uniref:metal-dependent hydrolase n=1 Tax=Caldalkalibacillus salinus TaxID=2803787 RepID=UPI0019205FD7|nr:metal-dependent hydrolase [Caldalkalibacillus salinus]
MDTVTHTLFGATLYAATNKEKMDKPTKRALLFTCLVGSQIPDIDVVSQFWDSEGLYQMWHRGITHSLFMVPLWAALLYGIASLVWRIKDKMIFYMGLLAVFIHSTSDLFNAWGTGYVEPFSSMRVTFGTIPIIDFVIWFIILIGFVLSSIRKIGPISMPRHRIYKWVWAVIVLHVVIQSAQGYVLYQKAAPSYEQHTLAASFVPGHFTVIGKNGHTVEITEGTAWGTLDLRETLHSASETDLDQLFEQNPAAETLYQWSPFVVVVDNDETLGIYDPRFYQDGQSFLFEYIDKQRSDP